MPNDTIILDLDEPKHKQMVIGWIKSCKGPHRIRITKVRKARSLNQNAWYWSCVLPTVAAGLLEAWGESLEVEDVHEWLKAKFNCQTLVDRMTGEVKGRRPCSTANLDTKEFSDYLEKIIKFTGEELQVEVPEPF